MIEEFRDGGRCDKTIEERNRKGIEKVEKNNNVRCYSLDSA